MGKTKYLKEFRAHFRDKSYFTTGEAERLLKQMGADKEYARLMLHQMEKRSEIKRLKRGYYSFGEDLDAVGFLFEPFYYGLQEALSLHDLWEQETNPVIITTRKVRTGLRSILGRNVLIRRIRKGMFFGYGPKRVGNAFLPVSDVEKTLIDFVYFRIPVPENALDGMIRSMDEDKLHDYLKKINGALGERVKRLLENGAVPRRSGKFKDQLRK
jgi:predicted transcriptional regulator of viral defense system